MVLKVDFIKVYDCLEWGFIKEILEGFGFPDILNKVMMSCMCILFIFILWNGEVCNNF